jgi:hypothetical protein
MAAGHRNNGMLLYGHHDESNRSCNNMHQLARFNGTHMTKWTPLRHHVNNVQQVLSDFLNKPDNKLTDSQRAGETALRSALRYDIPENPAAIVNALDAILFGNLLNNKVRVSIVDMRGDEGQTSFIDDKIPRTAVAVIKVHNYNGPNDSYYLTRPQEKRLRILATLIHEMCHAFLKVYGCDGRECATKQEVMYGRGFTGHGPAWKTVADIAEGVFETRIVDIIPNVDYNDDDPFGIPAALQEEDDYRRRVA